MGLKTNRKILYCFLFAAFFVLAPLKAKATLVYVQVQITHLENYDGRQNLLPAGTILSIKRGSMILGTFTTTDPTAINETITSALVDLTSGSQYTASVETYMCSTPGKFINGHCWYKGNNLQSCNTVCSISDRGGTEDSLCKQSIGLTGTDCSAFSQFGITCSSCSVFCPVGYSPLHLSCINCYPGDISPGSMCAYASNSPPICACKGQLLPFTFYFTANL